LLSVGTGDTPELSTENSASINNQEKRSTAAPGNEEIITESYMDETAQSPVTNEVNGNPMVNKECQSTTANVIPFNLY